jgi:sirohydrochlorin ferrochelatase
MTGLLTRRVGDLAVPPLSHHRHSTPPPRPGRPARDVVLVSHGSRDPRAAVATGRLRDVVAAMRPEWRVRVAYLDFTAPSLAEALAAAPASTVVPLLLTPAYHAKIDIPTVVAASGTATVTTAVLGPLPTADVAGQRRSLGLLVDALASRLSEALPPPSKIADLGAEGPAAVVLAAAGSRDIAALGSVDTVAAALGERLCRPVVVGYASGSGRPIAEAIEVATRVGGANVAIASYFLAPGVLSDRIAVAAAAAGIGAVAAPLADAAEVAQLVIYRVERGVAVG